MNPIGRQAFLSATEIAARAVIQRGQKAAEDEISKETASRYEKLLNEYPIDEVDSDIQGVADNPVEAIDIEGQPTGQATPDELNQRDQVAVSCLACAKAHLASTSAFLDEATRFASSEGIEHQEVKRRVLAATKEILALERFDWAPNANYTAQEQELIDTYKPLVRELRQDLIANIHDKQDLENLAAIANSLLLEIDERF